MDADTTSSQKVGNDSGQDLFCRGSRRDVNSPRFIIVKGARRRKSGTVDLAVAREWKRAHHDVP